MEERNEREGGGGDGGGGGRVGKVVIEDESNAKVGGAEAAEDENEVVRWQKLLPRMPVSVLLVEADDSTRQIISALLRKCSYRVAAASDGLKAWEMLKDKYHNIDLVLTEVDLPSISGFGLLTMIMDHENYKNIPVIMMSSRDSMSTVFKCMMKGAADFLVKPIRKNELRNLWQHVWRKQLTFSGHDGPQGDEDENESYRLNAGVRKGIYPCDTPANKECSEQDSDAQSSCTRSEMETESAGKKKVQNPKLQIIEKTNSKDTLVENDIGNMQLQSASVTHETEAKDPCFAVPAVAESDMLTKQFEVGIASENHGKRRKTSKEAADLLNMFECQQWLEDVSADNITCRNDLSDIVEASLNENECKGNSSHMPQLELTLRRCEESSWSRKEKDTSGTLNHSNSSAFSRYNSRMAEPNLSKPSNLTTQGKDITSSSHNLQDQESTDASRVKITLEDSKTINAGSAGKDRTAVQAIPFQVIPFSFPVGGMPINNICSTYGSVMQPIFYQQPAHPSWHTVSSSWQDRAPYGNSTIQSEPQAIKPVQDDNSGDHTARTPAFHTAEKQVGTVVPLVEFRCEPSITAESTSASICSSSVVIKSSSSSQCVNFYNDTPGIPDTSNFSKEPAGGGHGHGLFTNKGVKPADFPQLSHRASALNKFRLKRKERCFKKKVRYESRKVLAEQRPRVKGQFVRKEQLVSALKPSSCSGSNLESE